MKGYWNRPEETAKVMTKDGFFKTGDMGIRDDKGYFKIVAMGGMDFLNELKEHNMASLPKIIAALKKLKK